MPSGVKTTHEEFVHKMSELHPDIDVVGYYINAKSHIKCRCKKCGNEWFAKPLNLTYRSHPTGCPHCKGAVVKTNEQFIEELKQLHPTVEVIGKYSNSHERVLLRCMKHNCEFEGIPTNLLRRRTTGCPVCEQEQHDGKFAAELKAYCIEHFPGTVVEYKVVKNPVTGRWMPFDIYIPNVNNESVFCEVMGQQHYRYMSHIHREKGNFYRQVARDNYKEDYAQKHGRYVEIDIRKVKTIDEAVEKILGHDLGFVQRMALLFKSDAEMNADEIDFIYNSTESCPVGGLKNLWKKV